MGRHHAAGPDAPERGVKAPLTMIPFGLHCRIPFVRRPFYQRDQAIQERDEARTEITRLRSLGPISNEPLRGSTRTAPAISMTPTQEMFVSWNAERLSISKEESLGRYQHSLSLFHSGHGGPEYRAYNDTSYRLFSVFVDDSPREVLDAYRFHANMHFLRMLAYSDLSIADSDPMAERLGRTQTIDILDFGCGLAHKARALARWATARGIVVTLHLADIPTIRKDFLLWMLQRQKISTMFYDCTQADPIPSLPPCDVCFVTEFFEHVYDPVRYLSAFDAAIRPGGLLVTNVAEHNPEFMHVTPHLNEVRSRIAALGYSELVPLELYQKRS